jgi:hypothetical protein
MSEKEDKELQEFYDKKGFDYYIKSKREFLLEPIMNFEDNKKFHKRLWKTGEISRVLLELIKLNIKDIIKVEISNHSIVYKVREGYDIFYRARRKIYPGRRDLTIRVKSAFHFKEEELNRLMNGEGKYFLTVYAPEDKIEECFIVDLDCLRKSGLLDFNLEEIKNLDGTKFTSFQFETLYDSGCIVSWISDLIDFYVKINEVNEELKR